MKKRLLTFPIPPAFPSAWFAITNAIAAVEWNPSLPIERVSPTSTGAEFVETFDIGLSSVSVKEHHLMFTSQNALVPSDTNGYFGFYLPDRKLEMTTPFSLTQPWGISNLRCSNPVISADRGSVAFVSPTDNRSTLHPRTPGGCAEGVKKQFNNQ